MFNLAKHWGLRTPLLALLGLAVVLCAAAASADILTWGSLAQAPGETRGIYDWELQDLIASKIGTASDILIVNTACFGGNFFENFNSTTGDTTGGGAFDINGFTNTTIISGNPAGKETYYGGFHRNAAKATKPGNTSNDVAGAAHDSRETPQNQGANKTIGGTSSTHVLVWAGQPNDQDRADITDIKNNFGSGAGTTIHVLAGNDAAGTTGNVTTGPATLSSLESALTTIGAAMGAGEQFVLFVTDHGDEHKIDNGIGVVASGSTQPFTVPIETHTLELMLGDPFNEPTITLATADPIIETELVQLALVSSSPIAVTLNDPIVEVGSLVLPDLSTATTYTIPLADFNFDLSLSSTLSPQQFGLNNQSSNPIDFLFADLGSGAISRLSAFVPEPSTLVLLVIGLAAAMAGRRRRRN